MSCRICNPYHRTLCAATLRWITIRNGVLAAVLLIPSVFCNRLVAQGLLGRPTVMLDGNRAQLVVDLAGGSIVNFHLKNLNVNPLVWGDKDASSTPRAMGHFLCLDRWGAPSDAEAKNGMMFHGEASQVLWEHLPTAAAQNGKLTVEMAATLPIAGLRVRRTIEMSPNRALFTVREAVTNMNKLGRIYNMVQHPTIGPPFLDESTMVDSNAGKGFMQSAPMPNPESISISWPTAINKGRKVDLRRLTTDPDPNVVSFTVDGKYGWVTACNPNRRLLIGYIWKTADYPWFNAWRHVDRGKPLARGLEFGTTGLHQPFPILVSKGTIFDRPLFEYIDANETKTKQYACFLIQIPGDFKGVDRIELRAGRVVLYERGAKAGRTFTVTVDEPFLH